VDASRTSLFFWLGVGLLFAIAFGGGLIVMWARRNAKAPLETPRTAFTLDDLRRMREQGEITEREFETARDIMIHKTREAAERDRARRGGTDWGDGRGQRP
jgi:hypothetical protein